jgi:hypothetical protein
VDKSKTDANIDWKEKTDKKRFCWWFLWLSGKEKTDKTVLMIYLEMQENYKAI